MKTQRSIAVISSAAILAAALATPAVTATPDGSDGLLGLALTDALDMGQVAPPPPGVGLLMKAHFPADDPLEIEGEQVHALAVHIGPDGGVMTRNSEAGSSSTTTVAGKCRDRTFVPMGVTWAAEDMPVRWKFNNRTLPPRVVGPSTLRALRRAHRAWPRLFSPCRDGANNSFSFRFAGFSRTRIGYDGVDNIDFGPLGSGALAVSYIWYRRNRIAEVDLRLNRFDYPWTNRFDRPNRFLVRNVATHEIGHQLGLDDLGDAHRHQTMFGRTLKGESRKMRLGRGDMRGAAVLSP